MVRRTVLRWALMATMALSALLADQVRAQVTLFTQPMHVPSGKTGGSLIRIESAEPVDAINGEITFNSALLSNPQLYPIDPISDFTLLTNLVSPGVFRFVLYRNPVTVPIPQNDSVLVLGLTAAPGLTNSVESPVVYSIKAAARIDPNDPTSAISIGIGGPGGNPPAQNVDFQTFSVFIGGSEVRDWALYN